MRNVSFVLRCAAGVLACIQTAHGQGYSPQEAVAKMTTGNDLKVSLVASEPKIRQPILVKVDDRGRLWTIQYLQYPNPAGLKRVKVDRWSRTVYDRVPLPPPRGPRGADRITILSDANNDGKIDLHRDFVTGLNLATGLAFGNRGVYVLQVPYLLFYADENRDDVPDGPPQVLLKGFGMEDAQSLANHLTWGPDGWLYGVNGSTTTCRIRGIEFQQGVWRYHPRRDKFELYCEGGGNTFGLTFDEMGNLFYSTNGGPFIHALQGAYYRKSFGKHGPLHNLYTYGHYEIVKRDQVPGGPPTGGTIYLGPSFPNDLRNSFIAGNFLGHTVSYWKLTPHGSTFQAKYGGQLLNSHDTWFGATDVCLAPDGSMFVCDFHDQRTSHPDPDARWDRSNGRIYRLSAETTPKVKPFDFAKMSANELLHHLLGTNGWFADRARVELAHRRDGSLVPALERVLRSSKSESKTLQSLWAIHASDGLTDATALAALRHSFPNVRRWAVHLIGDQEKIAKPLLLELVALATNERSTIVRLQLAATARRLPSDSAIALITRLAEMEVSDERFPLALWWALEAHSATAVDSILQEWATDSSWQRATCRALHRNLVRRWAASGQTHLYDAAAKLIAEAPNKYKQSLLPALSQGLSERGRTFHGIGQGGLFEQYAVIGPDGGKKPTPEKADALTPRLRQLIKNQWQSARQSQTSLALALQADVREARQQILAEISDGKTTNALCAQRLSLLSQYDSTDHADQAITVFRGRTDPKVRASALPLIATSRERKTAEELLDAYSSLDVNLKRQVRSLLLSRVASAELFLRDVSLKKINPKEVAPAELRIVRIHNSSKLNAIVNKHWGAVRSGTPEEKLATMRRFNNDLRAGPGNVARGRLLFRKHCAVCHKLHGEGNQVGPDLTSANRKDRAALLANIVDPSAVVRREYISYQALTGKGRVLAGLLAAQDAASITLLTGENKRIRIARDNLQRFQESPKSLMPDDLLQKLSPGEVRDLFQFLGSDTK